MLQPPLLSVRLLCSLIFSVVNSEPLFGLMCHLRREVLSGYNNSNALYPRLIIILSKEWVYGLRNGNGWKKTSISLKREEMTKIPRCRNTLSGAWLTANDMAFVLCIPIHFLRGGPDSTTPIILQVL